MRKRHHLMKANLQVNLAVLDTAHQIAETLMRQTAQEVERTRTPQIYGAPHARPQPTASARGIALDRSL
ncbi:hypothetical protein [Methylobrevis pamukkalensis]|uniref:Uncharacterized protein n=1 Tax=Methylobrevis pamukkalensis TaxID=1439726 RepID=A0A1E3GZ64_9HYPH|nr:hypothetical protein [Methylobrevis pamukkalensis]ODN69333.1 hypothetical protein A6302_03353 [Methylobrevis pamukkalensis]